ncbi:MAG: glycosyltransferase family 4 protein [Phycisphaerae bacterium]|nr:glycosyltransferase family 4 protein [Phycisphaerae bacterium]
MQLAFCLFKYFPYGGLERNFLCTALACQAKGHTIRVYTRKWSGKPPPGFDVRIVPVRAWRNHTRCTEFAAWVQADLARQPVDCVIGFNKMPGLDIYYAADVCFVELARTLHGPLYRLGGRYRHFAALERAVFAAQGHTKILTISPVQQADFERHYGTPPERFHLLPPGIARDRRAPPDAPAIREAFRAEFGLGNDDLLLLFIGSDFVRKGLDRAIKAMGALPESLRRRARLFVLGSGKPRPFRRLIRSSGLDDQIVFLDGRDDIPRFLFGADLLIHPAYYESAGMALLEAVVSGLPVLVTDVCGYAHYIEDAQAGRVIASPFAQAALNTALADMLANPEARTQWARNALAFAEQADLYGRHEKMVEIITNTRRTP